MKITNVNKNQIENSTGNIDQILQLFIINTKKLSKKEIKLICYLN